MLLLSCLRQLSSTSVNNLAIRIKQLNDNKQFIKAIALFDKHGRELQSNSLAINQTLRACLELGDFKRGKEIHERLSPYLIDNAYIRTSLIRLYSRPV